MYPRITDGGDCSGVATVSKSLLIVLGTSFRERPPRTATLPPAYSCQWFTPPPPLRRHCGVASRPYPAVQARRSRGSVTIDTSLLAGGKRPLLGGHPFGGRVDLHNAAQLRVHLTFGLFPHFNLICPNWLIIWAGSHLPIPSAGNASPLDGCHFALTTAGHFQALPQPIKKCLYSAHRSSRTAPTPPDDAQATT